MIFCFSIQEIIENSKLGKKDFLELDFSKKILSFFVPNVCITTTGVSPAPLVTGPVKDVSSNIKFEPLKSNLIFEVAPPVATSVKETLSVAGPPASPNFSICVCLSKVVS